MRLLDGSPIRLAVPAFGLTESRLAYRAVQRPQVCQGEMLALFQRELRGAARDQFTLSEAREAEDLRAIRAALHA